MSRLYISLLKTSVRNRCFDKHTNNLQQAKIYGKISNYSPRHDDDGSWVDSYLKSELYLLADENAITFRVRISSSLLLWIIFFFYKVSDDNLDKYVPSAATILESWLLNIIA